MTDKKTDCGLVVTTLHKGVFFGYGLIGSLRDATIELREARMCVYWSSDVKGVLGLAHSGPKPNCRITPKVPKILVRDVTSVMEATAEAVTHWEKGYWA